MRLRARASTPPGIARRLLQPSFQRLAGTFASCRPRTPRGGVERDQPRRARPGRVRSRSRAHHRLVRSPFPDTFRAPVVGRRRHRRMGDPSGADPSGPRPHFQPPSAKNSGLPRDQVPSTNNRLGDSLSFVTVRPETEGSHPRPGDAFDRCSRSDRLSRATLTGSTLLRAGSAGPVGGRTFPFHRLRPQRRAGFCDQRKLTNSRTATFRGLVCPTRQLFARRKWPRNALFLSTASAEALHQLSTSNPQTHRYQHVVRRECQSGALVQRVIAVTFI